MRSKSIENEVGLNKRTKKERKMNFLKIRDAFKKYRE